jgi:hypothetical protein
MNRLAIILIGAASLTTFFAGAAFADDYYGCLHDEAQERSNCYRNGNSPASCEAEYQKGVAACADLYKDWGR